MIAPQKNTCCMSAWLVSVYLPPAQACCYVIWPKNNISTITKYIMCNLLSKKILKTNVLKWIIIVTSTSLMLSIPLLLIRPSWIQCINTSPGSILWEPTIFWSSRTALSGHMFSLRLILLLSQLIKTTRYVPIFWWIKVFVLIDVH